MFQTNNKGFNNFPIKTFSNAVSSLQDYNRINLMRDRGIIYQPNGGGRDTYIYNNNGGFAKMKEPIPGFKPGAMYGSRHANS